MCRYHMQQINAAKSAAAAISVTGKRKASEINDAIGAKGIDPARSSSLLVQDPNVATGIEQLMQLANSHVSRRVEESDDEDDFGHEDRRRIPGALRDESSHFLHEIPSSASGADAHTDDVRRLNRNRREQKRYVCDIDSANTISLLNSFYLPSRSLKISDQIISLGRLLVENGIPTRMSKFDILVQVEVYLRALKNQNDELMEHYRASDGKCLLLIARASCTLSHRCCQVPAACHHLNQLGANYSIKSQSQ